MTHKKRKRRRAQRAGVSVSWKADQDRLQRRSRPKRQREQVVVKAVAGRRQRLRWGGRKRPPRPLAAKGEFG